VSENELNIEPSVALRIEGQRLTPRQLEVLVAVYEEGSQNKAAARLGISTPVLHRYIAQIEGKLSCPLITTSSSGSRLNELGERIVMEYEALAHRMRRDRTTVIGGTIITEELLLNALSRVDPEGNCELIISDDARNLKDFRAGMMDIVILDDPMHLFDLEGVIWQEITADRLLHVDNGSQYVRFMYGAQRIGFRHLDALGVEYSIEHSYRSIPALLASGRSFFINESLALRKGLRIKSATDPAYLEHRINAVYRKETSIVRRLVRRLRREGRVV